MGVYTTPTQLAVAQKARFLAVIAKQKEGHRELAKAGLEDFHEVTSGPLKKGVLRSMGHPYAKGALGSRGISNPAKRSSSLKGQVSRGGMVRPLPINIQSGKLKASIRLAGPNGSNYAYTLGAYAPHAKYVLKIGGTSRMVERPVFKFLRTRHKARIAVLIAEVRARQKQA